MLSTKSQKKLDRRQRGTLLVLGVLAIAVLVGLYQISQTPLAGLPTLIPPLFGQTATPRAVAFAPAASASPTPGQDPALLTATVNALPPWLTDHSTPTRPNEAGPTSTPSTYFVFLPGLGVQPTPTGLPALLKTEPPPVPPTPSWPDGLADHTASRIGLHVVRNADPYIMEFVRRVRPRVMKSVDDLGWLSDVKAASPNTTIQTRTWTLRMRGRGCRTSTALTPCCQTKKSGKPMI